MKLDSEIQAVLEGHSNGCVTTGDCLDALRSLPDNCVQVCLTSPPYFGLREYGIKGAEWPSVTFVPVPGLPALTVLGCDPECEHEWGDRIIVDKRGLQVNTSETLAGPQHADGRNSTRGHYCRKCGGWRGSHGLEPDVWSYVAHEVLIFREVRRVLRPDGCLWLNLSGSYASGGIHPSRFLSSSRVPACDSGDRAQSDSQETDSSCLHPDDGHPTDSRNRRDHISRNGILRRGSSCEPCQTDHDMGYQDYEEASLPSSPASAPLSTTPSLSDCVADVSGPEDVVLVSQTVKQTCAYDASPCARMKAGQCEPKKDVHGPQQIAELSCSTSCTFSTDDASGSRISDTASDSVSSYISPGSISLNYTIGPHQFKSKNLIDIPHMVAHALQGDGWWLRSALPWLKGSAMPESVQDRPANAVEYFFLLTKTAKPFFDMEAVKVTGSGLSGGACFGKVNSDGPSSRRMKDGENESIRNGTRSFRNSDLWYESFERPHGLIGRGDDFLALNVNPEPFIGQYCTGCGTFYAKGWKGLRYHVEQSGRVPANKQDATGNRTYTGFNERWDGKEPAKETKHAICAQCGCWDKWLSHFATFGQSLITPLIRASTSAKGCCPQCGAPWRRITQKEKRPRGDAFGCKNVGNFDHGQAGSAYLETVLTNTVGWQPACSCDAGDPVGCLVLDCFSGSSTVAVVAAQEGQRYIMLEANPHYADMARQRLSHVEELTPPEQAVTGQLPLFGVRP